MTPTINTPSEPSSVSVSKPEEPLALTVISFCVRVTATRSLVASAEDKALATEGVLTMAWTKADELVLRGAGLL